MASLTIKSNLSGDIRRFTFDEAKYAAASNWHTIVAATLREAYSLGVRPFTITYVDDEGDQCSVGGDEEMREAIRFACAHQNKVLKLTIVASSVAAAPAPSAAQPVMEASKQAIDSPKENIKLAAVEEVQPVAVELIRPSVEFVADVTIDDGALLPAGATVVKTWAVKNSGRVAWPADCSLQLVEVEPINENSKEERKEGKVEAKKVYPLPTAQSNETVNVSVDVTVPVAAGNHRIEFRLVCGDGKPFDGDYKLWLSLEVKPALSAAFESDVTMEDGVTVLPNATVRKVWRVKNDGTAAWPFGSLLVHSDGAVVPSPLFASEAKGVAVPSVAPGESVELAVHVAVPSTSGKHHGEWHLVTSDGTKFANDYALWIQVTVAAPVMTTGDVIAALPEWIKVAEIRSAMEKALKQSPTAVAVAAAVAKGEVVHDKVICDGCGACPIIGQRFKCTTCADFDFCAACEAKSAEKNCNGEAGGHPKEHVFLKAKLPLQRSTPLALWPWRRAQAAPIAAAAVAAAAAPVADSKANWRAAAPTPQAVPVAIPAVAVAVAAAAGKSVKKELPRCEYKADVTLPDGTRVECGTIVTKRWTVVNAGKEQWPAGVQLMFVGGALHPSLPLAESLSPVPTAEAGAAVDVWANVAVPNEAGRHTGYYRLATSDGKRFGHRLWCDIVAVEKSVADAAPIAIAAVPPTAAAAAAAPAAVAIASPKIAPIAAPVVVEPIAAVAVAAPVAPSKPAFVAKYPSQLAALQAMGFKDDEMLDSLLQAANGREQTVVDWLTNPVV